MCTQIVTLYSTVMPTMSSNENIFNSNEEKSRIFDKGNGWGGWMRQSAFSSNDWWPLLWMSGELQRLQLPAVAFILQLDVAEHKPTMTITNDGMLDTSHPHNNNNNSNNFNKMKKNDKILKMNESVWQNTVEIYWLLVSLWSPNVMNRASVLCVRAIAVSTTSISGN